MADRMQLFN